VDGDGCSADCSELAVGYHCYYSEFGKCHENVVGFKDAYTVAYSTLADCVDDTCEETCDAS